MDAWQPLGRGDEVVKQRTRVARAASSHIQIHHHDVIRVKAVVDGDQVFQAARKQTSSIE